MAETQQQQGGGETPERVEQAPQQTAANQSRFLNKIVVNLVPKSRGGWLAVIFVILLLIVAWWRDFLGFRTKYGVTIIGAFTVLIIVGFILYGWFKSESDTRNANIFIATALSIWLLDLAPNSSLTSTLFVWLGPPYAGFDVPILSFGLVKITLVSVIFSTIFFVLVYLNMVFNIIRKEWLVFVPMFALILVLNYLVKLIVPDYADLSYSFPINKTTYIVVVIAVAAALGWLAWHLDKKHRGTAIPEFFSSLYMILIYSFLWLNNGWQGNIRAIIHAFYILAFTFLYIKQRSDGEIEWRIIGPSLVLLDFFGYGLLWNSDLLVLRFIPPIVLFVIIYCYEKETKRGEANYTYPVAVFILLVTFILLMSVDKVGGFEDGTIPFVAKKGTSYKDLYGQFSDKLRGFVEDRLDIATAGLYRGAVEKNRYESLGVYFANVRAADPRFYTSEPITVWGAIRSKTYQDAVIISFGCNRTKGNKRIPADKTIPEVSFPIFTLEEVDTECVFNPREKESQKNEKIEPGPNTITLSAEYNFVTNAYLKTYFMDRERFRAYARNNIEPLTELGIKDRNPTAKFTNGPVEIGMSTGQPLVTISQGSLIKPSIGITLTNRQEIQDKDKRVITRWEGVIKKITELVLLVPPGIEIKGADGSPIDDACNKENFKLGKCPCSMPFKKYDKEKCYLSCSDNVLDLCKKTCKGLFKESKDEKELKNCQEECQTSAYNCGKECDFLFQDEDTEGSTDKKYTGYSLDVSRLESQGKDLNKDIDKHRSFQCRFEVEDKDKFLDKSPITTRYFRVRARYNYLLENSVVVNVEELPTETISTVPQDLIRIPIEYRPNENIWQRGGVRNDLAAAVALVESGWRHCCAESGKNHWHDCKPSTDTDCDENRILTSYDGSSAGIMQINRVNWGMVSEVCEGIKDVKNRECNIRIGIKILSDYFNQYGSGIPPTKLSKFCPNNPPYEERYKKYSEYTGIRAALRAYNGLGCRPDKGCEKACQYSRNSDLCKKNCIEGTLNYVEKVMEKYNGIEGGIIVNNFAISSVLSSEDAQSTREDESGVDMTSQLIQPTVPTLSDSITPCITGNPCIKSIDTDQIVQGLDITIKFSGENFQDGVEGFFTPGNENIKIDYVSENEIHFNGRITSQPGRYYIQIKNSNGKRSNQFKIYIVAPLTAQTPPQATYDIVSNTAIISWKRLTNEDTYYAVSRSDGESLTIQVCSDIKADSKEEQYHCVDDNYFIPGTRYIYNIYTYAGTIESARRTAYVNIPPT